MYVIHMQTQPCPAEGLAGEGEIRSAWLKESYTGSPCLLLPTGPAGGRLGLQMLGVIINEACTGE